MTDSPEARQTAAGAFADLARKTLTSTAKEKGKTLVHVSHIARLAADRLEQTALPSPDIAAATKMLRQIQNDAHLAYLDAGGSEADYQAAGSRVAKTYQTPSGRWRTL